MPTRVTRFTGADRDPLGHDPQKIGNATMKLRERGVGGHRLKGSGVRLSGPIRFVASLRQLADKRRDLVG